MTKAWILIAGISIFFTACEKESTEEVITQEKFVAPTVESARQFVTSNRNNISFKSSSSNLTSVTHWEGSKTKKYKQTEGLDVDILYTPIYVNSPRTDIKGFLASTEQNGIVDSRKFYILYKSNDLSNGLNAYILIYGLDGNLQLAYNFENGQSVTLPESINGGSTLNKSSGECDGNISSMTDEEFENWWANCSGIALDEVIVTAPAPLTNEGPNSGSTSAFNDWNSSQWVGVHIPAVTNPGGSNYNSGGTIGDNNTNWHNPNVTVANAPSIAAVLDAAFNSIIANWLREMEQSNQQILNQIAAYLNDNREENPFHDFTFSNVQPEQFPVSDSAIQYITDLINYLDDNPELDFGGMSQQQFDDLKDCYENNNNFIECFEEFIEAQINEELEDNPFLLLDIDCNQIQNWQTLAQHTAPQSVQNKIDNLPSSWANNFEIQSLSDAGGTMVNLDYFSVSVTNLPINPNTNTSFTANEFLDYMRRNFNDFVEGSTFEPYCEISSMCQTETDLWNSNNPLGSIIYIDIPFDDGVVVCTEYTNSYWYFMTMNAPYTGNHPVSGTRQFGFEQNFDGSYNFFVRGVDRFDSNLVENVSFGLDGFDNAFQGADDLWESFQNKTQQFINNNGGSSSIVTPVKNRPDWDKVQEVLNGERPINELGCD